MGPQSEPLPPSASDPGQDEAPDEATTQVQRTRTYAPPVSSSGEGDRRLPRNFGDYELLEEIARGGMGVVYKARQLKAGGRKVALKMILGGDSASTPALERFRREAVAVAGLDHPGIVPVYEVGEAEGQPFYSMALVEGGSLQSLLQARGPLEAPAAARMVQQVAEAVQHAHDGGVVHRDIKPANILLAFSDASQKRSGEERFYEASLNGCTPTPRLADFGLARTREGGQSVTGDIMGTPSYMAPEQAAGRVRAVGPATDVYSLGAVLYCVLTGRPPFQSASAVETMRQVLETEPVPLRRLNPGVPRDLETVCLKCLEKEPARRYTSARALADELGRFLDGRGVWARPVGPVARAWRWCRRNRLVASLLGLVGVLLAGGVGLGGYLAAQAQEKDRVKASRDEAVRQEGIATVKAGEAEAASLRAQRAKGEEKRARQETERLRYFNQGQLAHREWEQGNVARARELLEEMRKYGRGWESDYLSTLSSDPQRTLLGHTHWVQDVCFSPDGKRLASASADRTVRLWDAATGQHLLTLTGHVSGVRSVCFSPDGKRLASASWDKTVKVWDVSSQGTGRAVLTIQAHVFPVNCVCFSPDGRRLASAGSDQTVCVWDSATGRRQLMLQGHKPLISSVCFSPDGRRLAAASGDKPVLVWDAATGRRLFTLQGHGGGVESVCFSPDGRHLASGSLDRTVKVWDTQTGREVLTLTGHTNCVRSVCFSPDGRRLASASGDPAHAGELKVWDVSAQDTGREVFTLHGHTQTLSAVCFSPDGQRLASASEDRTVRIWDAQVGQQPRSLRGHTDTVFGVCFSPDGSRLASASGDQTVKVWDVLSPDSGQADLTLQGHTSQVYGVCFSPDGKRLASASLDGTVRVWGVLSRDVGRPPLILRGHTDSVRSVCFSPRGRRLASGGSDRTVRVWDVLPPDTGRQALELRGHTEDVSCVCFSPDGRRLASASWDRTVKVWDVSSRDMGRLALTLKGHAGGVTSVRFSPDGRHLVSGSQDRTARVWDVSSKETGREILALRGHAGTVADVVYSPDGSRLATASDDRTVRVWDARTGQEALTLRVTTGTVESVSFSPDGRRLAATSNDRTIRVWEAAGDKPGLPPRPGERPRLRRLAVPDPSRHREEARQSEAERDWFGAAFHLDRLHRLQPWDADVEVRRASALARLGRVPEAALAYVNAVTLSPEVSLWPVDPEAAQRGDKAAQEGNWSRAVEEFQTAIHQPVDPLPLWRSLLLARGAAGRADEARRSCREFLNFFESVAVPKRLWNVLIACRTVVVSGDDAARVVRLAQRLVARQRNASNLDLLGGALYRAGRFGDAARVLGEAIKAHGKGGYVESWLFLAMVKQQLGEAAEARRWLARVEGALKGHTFKTWQDRVYWELLSREARELILRMPRVTGGR